MNLPFSLVNLPRTSHWSKAVTRWIMEENMTADWMIINGFLLDLMNIIVDYKNKMNLINCLPKSFQFCENCWKIAQYNTDFLRVKVGNIKNASGLTSSLCYCILCWATYPVLEYNLRNIVVLRLWNLKKPFQLVWVPVEEWFFLGY